MKDKLLGDPSRTPDAARSSVLSLHGPLWSYGYPLIPHVHGKFATKDNVGDGRCESIEGLSDPGAEAQTIDHTSFQICGMGIWAEFDMSQRVEMIG